jgi:uncharacterized protein (TIGR03382 family)
MKNIVALFAGLALSGSAMAGMTEWDITLQAGSNNPWSVNLWGQSTVTVETQADGTVVTRIVGSHSNNDRDFSWDVMIEDNATRVGSLFVSSNFSVSNNTGVLTPYTINVFLPGALAGPTSMSGSISGSVGDGDGALDQFGAGATVQTQGFPIGANPYYQAIIDGAPVASLYNAPSINQAPLGFTSAIPTQTFAGSPGPAVAAFIGISNRFELTSADNAQFTSTFFVVPTPGAIALFGLAGLAGVRRRR